MLVDTAEVTIANDAVVAPSGTITEAGTVAAELDDSRETADPPEPAFFESVTLPVAEFPPLTEVGDTLRLRSDCACDTVTASAIESKIPIL
jgi:hypothetical protein